MTYTTTPTIYDEVTTTANPLKPTGLSFHHYNLPPFALVTKVLHTSLTWRFYLITGVLVCLSLAFYWALSWADTINDHALHPRKYRIWTRRDPGNDKQYGEIVEYEHEPVIGNKSTADGRRDWWQLVWTNGVWAWEGEDVFYGVSKLPILNYTTPLPPHHDYNAFKTWGTQHPLRFYNSRPWTWKKDDAQRSRRGPTTLWEYPWKKALSPIVPASITWITEDDFLPAALQCAANYLELNDKVKMHIIWSTAIPEDPPQESAVTESSAIPITGNSTSTSIESENTSSSTQTLRLRHATPPQSANLPSTISSEIEYWTTRFKGRLTLETTLHYPSYTKEQLKLPYEGPGPKDGGDMVIVDGTRDFTVKIMNLTTQAFGDEAKAALLEFAKGKCVEFDGCPEGRKRRGFRLSNGGWVTLIRDR